VKLWVPQVKVSFRTIELGKNSNSSTQKQPTRNKKLLVSVCTALVVIFIGTIIWRSMASPGHGNIAVLAQDTSSNTPLPEYTSLTTNYYSLNYSERYAQVATDIPPAGVLDYKVLSYKLGGQSGESKVQILVKPAPYGGIVLDSTYDYYAKHQQRYKMSNEFYHGEAINVARNLKGSPEAASIWLHDGFLLIIKITTPDSQQSIDGELKDMLSSVQWRQN
jgi:hypothetical protein